MPQTLNVGSRSVFVTTVAWVFIALAIAAVVSAVVRNAAADSLLVALPASGVARWVTVYLPWVMGAGVTLSLATLAAAIGLLLRLDWARRVFIGMLVVAIAANLAGLWLQHEVVQSVVSRTLSRAALSAPVLDVFGGFVTASRVMGALMTVATCLVLGWIIQRLMSSTVRQEFA